MKGLIYGIDIIVLEVEFSVLKWGLIEVVDLGINYIIIYSDNYLIYDLVSYFCFLI